MALSVEVEWVGGSATAAMQGTGPRPSAGQLAAYEYIRAHDEELRALTFAKFAGYVVEANERVRKYHGARLKELLAKGFNPFYTPPKDLKSELGGNLENVVLETLMGDSERDATALRSAMKVNI